MHFSQNQAFACLAIYEIEARRPDALHDSCQRNKKHTQDDSMSCVAVLWVSNDAGHGGLPAVPTGLLEFALRQFGTALPPAQLLPTQQQASLH